MRDRFSLASIVVCAIYKFFQRTLLQIISARPFLLVLCARVAQITQPIFSTARISIHYSPAAAVISVRFLHTLTEMKV
jgi:hypothetical protein